MNAWDIRAASRALTERDMMAALTDAATVLGWSWAHFRPAQTVHGWRTPVSGPLGEGFPDLILVRPRDRRLLFVELKTDRGRVSAAQAFVHSVLAEAGFDIRVIRPDDFDDILEALR